MWESLFKKAMQILGSANIPPGDWTFGGGTTLTIRYRHRESYDIDIFIPDTQQLTFLTPRLNRSIDEIVDYTEASNFIKLVYPCGEVDFIAAPHLTPQYFTYEKICDQVVRVETPVEVVVKKLFYRAEGLKVRDIIDTVVVAQDPAANLLAEAAILGHKLEVLKWRWEILQPHYSNEARNLKGLEPRLREKAPLLFGDFLNQVEQSIIKPI